MGRSLHSTKFIIKEDNKQVKLATAEPQQTKTPESTGYIQNEEQSSEQSKWKTIRPKDE